MRLTNCRSGLFVLGMLAVAAPARADLVYPVSYTGTGVTFICDAYAGAACSVSGGGSIVTLFNNGGSLTFQASLASGSFVASSASSVTFPLITFSSTVNGPFTLPPSPIHSNEPFFVFSAFFTWMTADGNSPFGIGGGFYHDPGDATGHFALGGSQFAPPSSSLPGSARVSGGATSPPFLTFGVANTSGTIFGSASIAPEPSTIVLSGSGLGLLGLIAKRRKRRSA